MDKNKTHACLNEVERQSWKETPSSAESCHRIVPQSSVEVWARALQNGVDGGNVLSRLKLAAIFTWRFCRGSGHSFRVIPMKCLGCRVLGK